ncbi:MAG: ARMT1-like domain-containing protein [Candidatus Omnitrophota bacterium]
MRTYFDCIPCFVNQALQAVRTVTDDEGIQEQVLRSVLRAVEKMDLRQSPPAMGQTIHRLIREVTGNIDPYREHKRKWNRFVLNLLPELRLRVETSSDPFQTAVRLAIAGNIIDSASNHEIDEQRVISSVDRALLAPLDEDAVVALYGELVSAQRILYLADNAGEIVFDRLLIEQLPMERVTLAVKGAPVINDATLEDAEQAGMTELVRVISNGSDAPGTMLEQCSVEFRQEFKCSDVVIAKGQANYETLNDSVQNLFFVLMAKCPVIARDIGCRRESLVVIQKRAVEFGQTASRKGID